MGRGWLQGPRHLFPGVPGVPGPWSWELRRGSWPSLGTAQVPAVGTWCTGADEMFLTAVLTGQVLGTRRVKGKRKGWGEEMVFFSAALGTQKCQTGEDGAAGRGVYSWVLLP